MTESGSAQSTFPLEAAIPQASLESILLTEELERRPSRPPDYKKESRALQKLISALADSPSTVLETLAETILDITQCDSAGLSLLTSDGKTPDVCGERFYWPAIAGMWNPHVGGGTPRNFGPCGDVLDQNRTLLFKHFERRYPYLQPVIPDAEECLLVPFYVAERAVGTIWAILHSDRRKFDAEDDRVMGSLGKFASSAYQALVSVDELRFQIGEREKAEAALRKQADELEKQVGVRTRKLAASEARARELADEQAALRRVATLVAAGIEPEELFSAVSDEVARLFTADWAAVGRYEPDGSRAVLVGASEDLPGIPVGTRSGLDKGIVAGEIYRTGRPARNDDDARAIDGTARQFLALGFISTVGAPIVVEGELWGYVAASSSHTSLPADTEKRLERFSELVATAVANAESRAELAASETRARELADEQAALRRLATLAARESPHLEVLEAVAEEAARVLKVDAIGMLRFEPDETATLVAQSKTPWDPPPIGTRFTLEGENIVAAVHRTGQAARMDDWESATGAVAAMATVLGVRSAVASPIVVEGRLWGTMIAASNQSPPLPADTESRIVEFTELLATAISNAESREALTRLADERETLRRVATLIAQGASPDAVFVAVCDEALELFDAEQSSVVRLEVDDQELVVVGTSTGLPGVAIGLRAKLGEWPTTSAACRTGRTARTDVTAEETTGTGLIPDMIRAKGFLSTVSAPIVVEGRLWGAMTVSDSRRALTSDTERRIENFTDLIATAISSREARDQVARLLDEQAALRRMATLVAAGIGPDELFSAVSEEVARLFKADGAAVGRFEPDGSGIVAVGRSRGLRSIPVGTRADIDEWPTLTVVHRTRHAARWSDKFYSSVTAPIMVGGSLWGVLTAGSGREGFPSDTEERLEKFGDLVATAIANAESRAELAASEARARELANEQAALRRVATLVAQGASPDELFFAVADEVAGIIDIPVVGVQRYEADGTFTVVGVAGETKFTVGSRWPVEDEGIAGMILATGSPARRNDYSTMPGPLGRAARDDQMVSTVGVPIVVDGSIWGFMVAAAKPGGGPIPSDIEDRLVRFTELVATAVSNATTRTELLTSRARVVSAADETRRRLERDLHDGIQQWLVALALRARKAAGLSAAGESSAQELSSLADDLVAVTDELREISRGIHPAILSDSGLDDALDVLARRSAIRVDLDVSFERRFDPTLEATVYYVVAESITNAVKHAQVSTVAVRGGLRGGAIELEIEDEGVGGADPSRGTGLIGLKDRVDTLGGTISFASPADRGTKIRVMLPTSARPGEDPTARRRDDVLTASGSG